MQDIDLIIWILCAIGFVICFIINKKLNKLNKDLQRLENLKSMSNFVRPNVNRYVPYKYGGLNQSDEEIK